MSLGTLSFEIEADDSGADDALDEIADRLAGIEENLGEVADAAGEAGDAMEDVGKKTGLALNMKAVKMFAKAIKELGGFIYDSAKQAADAGSGPMKHFVDDIDKLQQSFVKVGAQAASQLLPVLDHIVKAFTGSKDSADALRKAGNFLADLFRTLGKIGVVVAGVFDVVGTSLGAAASMIVSLLSGDVDGAMEAFRANLEEIEKTGKRVKDALSVLDLKGGDFKGSVDVKGKKETEAKNLATAEYQKAIKAIDEEVRHREALYDAIGDETAQFAIATEGTKSFDSAMTKYEWSAREAARLTEEAADDQAKGLTYLAGLTKQEADAWKEKSDKYLAAADAWAAKQQKNVEQLQGTFEVLGQSVLKAIPRLNELVSAAMQGAQVGGVWGALIAVIVQLMSKTQAFQRILDIVNGDLDQFIAGLEPIVSGLAGFIEAFDGISNTMTGAFAQIFQPIGDILQAFVPVIKILSDAIAPLAGMLGFIGDLLKPVVGIIGLIAKQLEFFLTPLKLATVIFKGLGALLKLFMIPLDLIGRLFSGLADMLDPVIKEIDKALSWLANRFDEFGAFMSTLGERIENFVKGKGFVSNYERDHPNGPGYNAATGSNAAPYTDRHGPIAGQGGDDQGLVSDVTRFGDATSDATDAQHEYTKATVAATEALQNVPTGYKVAVQRFAQSQALGDLTMVQLGMGLLAQLLGLGVPHMAEGGIVTAPTLALIGEAGPEAVVPLGRGGGAGGNITIENLTVVTSDPDDFVRKLRRKAFMKTGAAFG